MLGIAGRSFDQMAWTRAVRSRGAADANRRLFRRRFQRIVGHLSRLCAGYNVAFSIVQSTLLRWPPMDRVVRNALVSAVHFMISDDKTTAQAI